MNHHLLREFAKVAVGFVIADLFSAIWFATAGVLPLTILGVLWTNAMLPGVLLFDAALLVLLVQYGWNVRLPLVSPSERALLSFLGLVFLVIAVLHLSRLLFGWELVLGFYKVPLWVSWFGVAVTAYLSYASFYFAGHARVSAKKTAKKR